MKGTRHISFRYYVVLGALGILFFVLLFAGNVEKPIALSVEVGFSSVSSKGSEGGLAIPASCMGNAHCAVDCTSCSSGVNVCGMTNTGRINCASPNPECTSCSCSASTPPSDSLCDPTATISDSPDPTEQGDSYTVTWTTNLSSNNCSVAMRMRPPAGPWGVWNLSWATSIGNGSRILVDPDPEAIDRGNYEFYSVCTNIYGPVATSPTITHTVDEKAPVFNVSQTIINEGDSVTINWICYYSSPNSADNAGASFSTDTDGDGLGNSSGTVVVNPKVTTQYSLSCENTGFAQKTVTVRTPTLGITAVPPIIQPNSPATVTWTAFGVNSCTVTGTDGFFDSVPPTPPDLVAGDTWSDTITTGDLTGQTIYTLTCQTVVDTYIKTVIININPIFEEF